MKTAKAVVDGQVSDELLGQINRKVGEIVRRMKGTNKPLDPQWVLCELQKVVEGPRWRTWKSVVVGEGKYPAISLFAEALIEKGWGVSENIDELLKGTIFREQSKKLLADLVTVTAEDLMIGPEGRADSVSFYLGAAYKQALKFGLQLCPVEAGLLSFMKIHPSNDEPYVIAMEPIMDKDSNEPSIIGQFESEGKLWRLSAFPKSQFLDSTKLIFCKGFRKYPTDFTIACNKLFKS